MKENQIYGTVFIVDDILENLQLLSELLSGYGYKIRAAKTGRETIASINAELPDIILLDIKLPDINGYDVCAALKSNDKTSGIPVIFISALHETAEKQRGFAAGGVDYITKPFINEEVLDRVRTHLEISRLQLELKQQSLELQTKNDRLQLEISERKIAEEKIQLLLSEKELILSEVHHRIKNNMNTIHGLLKLQSYALKDASAIAALDNSAGRVQSMMHLYDKLYRSMDVQNLSVLDYIPSLVDEILKNFPEGETVKIEKIINDFILDAKRLQTLGIIINELLTNIMKYAFTGRDDRKIVVEAGLNPSGTKQDSVVSIAIGDNGLGMPETVDFVNSTGFGLQLVVMLVKELKGVLRFEKKNGTRIIIEFDI